MECSKCHEYLTHETIEEAFKKNPGLAGKVIGCIHVCYKEIFVNWAISLYRGYQKHYIEDVAEQSFIDTILVFRDHVTKEGLYKGGAEIKGILRSFYYNILRSNLKKDRKNPLGNPQNKAEDAIKTYAENINDDKEDLYDCLEKSMNQMNNEDRNIIIWRHIQHVNNKEIAQRIGMTYDSATNKIFRCMERLRILMKKCKNNNEHENKQRAI